MSNESEYYSLVSDVNDRYMDVLLKRNPELVESAIQFHQAGEFPPFTYIFDMDAYRKNAELMKAKAKSVGVELYYMSKQHARDPFLTKVVMDEGFSGIVAVDVQEALCLSRYGFKMAHVGHLVQIPVSYIDFVLSTHPEVWTVYSYENAKLISERASKKGITQNLLIQPIGTNDIIFDIMTGGFSEDVLISEVDRIEKLPGVKVVGTTNFPSLVFDVGARKVVPAPNFHTAVSAANNLRSELGIEITQINVAPNCHCSTFETIKEVGGTHAEPGAGLAGTNTLHAFEEQPEKPAVAYVTEVSHKKQDRLYAHGGGMAFPGGGFGRFPDGSMWHGGENLPMSAMVGSTPKDAMKNRIRAKSPGSDPFNYNLTLFPGKSSYAVGDTVVYAFNDPQIFTTRAWHAVVSGISQNDPKLVGIFDQGSNLVDKHGRLQGERKTIELMNKL